MPVRPVTRSAACGCVVAAALLAGCSSHTSTSAPSNSAARTVRTANVTVSAAQGCLPDRTQFSAGGITFRITNQDAVAVSEVELLDGERIVGEKENVPPGLSGEFAVKVPAGKYTLYCPGGTTERRTITVTGKAAVAADDSVTALLKTATADYKVYIDRQISYLVMATKRLDTTLHGTSLKQAQDAYIAARPFYEKIEPVAESFVSGKQNLDAEIDARVSNVASLSKWSGFHRIEKGLFADRSLAGMSKWGGLLVVDVATLKSKAAALTYQAPDLANGAQGLLDEVAATKITGEEERYSHIDILDMANNVEGSQQAFAALQPALQRIDSALTTAISARFAALQKVIDRYRSTSDVSGYVRYGALTDSDRRALAAAVKAVAEPLSGVASKVANA